MSIVKNKSGWFLIEPGMIDTSHTDNRRYVGVATLPMYVSRTASLRLATEKTGN